MAHAFLSVTSVFANNEIDILSRYYLKLFYLKIHKQFHEFPRRLSLSLLSSLFCYFIASYLQIADLVLKKYHYHFGNSFNMF